MSTGPKWCGLLAVALLPSLASGVARARRPPVVACTVLTVCTEYEPKDAAAKQKIEDACKAAEGELAAACKVAGRMTSCTVKGPQARSVSYTFPSGSADEDAGRKIGAKGACERFKGTWKVLR